MTITNDQYKDAAAAVTRWRNAFIFTHAKPDGDAIGAVAAIGAMLTRAGVKARGVLFEPLPDRLRVLPSFDSLAVLGSNVAENDLDTADGILIVDTCTYSQLEPIADWLRRSPVRKVVVDHHATREQLADAYLIDDHAAATCLLLWDWARAAGWPIDAEAASALFVGLATDTGWFRHSNTDERVFRVAAELVQGGAVVHKLYQALYLRDSAARLRLTAEALQSLELLSAGRLALLTLTRADFQRTGALPSDTEDLVNEPLRIASVVVSVLLVVQDDGLIRVNFRSKPPVDGVMPDVDVARIAAQFGGGGHVRAAGAKIRAPLAEVNSEVTRALEQVLVGH